MAVSYCTGYMTKSFVSGVK